VKYSAGSAFAKCELQHSLHVDAGALHAPGRLVIARLKGRRRQHRIVRARPQLCDARNFFARHCGNGASNELSDITNAVIEELKRNTLAAEATQQRQKAQIIEVASELGLNPRPAGHNDSAWIADCPRRTHTLMLSPSLNEFGCGYCRRKGDVAELSAFVDSFVVSTHQTDWFDYPDWSDRGRE
jgi:hypothetical protein